ncbi:hypothetical protein [Paenibacillus glycinis]|uniref:Uncharacterized protein n=1 Tax=Paenibacillus glycinis TaxID=2697035 RepID=A0ABW9XNE3_9BACL|nr:hypothetical protein [Paenibacillus glycinis]NBD24140.1 hypothetical protein [Paenibacillus glycinis]
MRTNQPALFLLCSLFIGVLIALSPVLVTGHWYNVNKTMGNLLIAEFIVRTLAIVFGLLVIFGGVKHFFLYRAK